MPLSYNAKVWRQMADRARALADRLANPALKARITRIAAGFDTLAERVDRLPAQGGASADRPSQPDEQQARRPDHPQ